MKTSEIKAVLDRIAPLSLQEDWDNSGMQIETGRDEINKILVALDIPHPMHLRIGSHLASILYTKSS